MWPIGRSQKCKKNYPALNQSFGRVQTSGAVRISASVRYLPIETPGVPMTTRSTKALPIPRGSGQRDGQNNRRGAASVSRQPNLERSSIYVAVVGQLGKLRRIGNPPLNFGHAATSRVSKLGSFIRIACGVPNLFPNTPFLQATGPSLPIPLLCP